MKSYSEADFDVDVLHNDRPVLVEFTASWCAPCRAVAPVLEKLSSEYAGRVSIGALDIDEHPRVAARFDVRSVPTMLLFENGAVRGQIVGARSKDHVEQLLKRATCGPGPAP